MSNKLVKNKPKAQNQANNDKTTINQNDPAFVKILKKRLQTISERDSKQKRFTSAIFYFFIEFALLSIYFTCVKNSEAAELYPTLVWANILISIYNIIMSIYQIVKLNYRKTGNIIIIILHFLMILLSFAALL